MLISPVSASTGDYLWVVPNQTSALRAVQTLQARSLQVHSAGLPHNQGNFLATLGRMVVLQCSVSA